MNMSYDEEVDVLTITFSKAPIMDSDEVQPGIILDFDEAGNTVSIELLDASKRIDNLYSVSYDFARVPSQIQNVSGADSVALSQV